MTKIDQNQTVFALCSAHPSLVEALVEAGFADIAKPGMLHTAGRVMTIPKGAALKKISMEHIRAVFAAHGFAIEEDA